MNGYMKSILGGIVIGSSLMTANVALANKVYTGDTKVEDVFKTVTQQVPHTEQQCKTVEVPVYGESRMDKEGAIVGGIIGGVIGNQIGKGGGKAAATGIGAIAGSIIGGKGSDEVVGYRQETQCKNMVTYTTETYEVYSHSIVTFEHEGRTYRVKFNK